MARQAEARCSDLETTVSIVRRLLQGEHAVSVRPSAGGFLLTAPAAAADQLPAGVRIVQDGDAVTMANAVVTPVLQAPPESAIAALQLVPKE